MKSIMLRDEFIARLVRIISDFLRGGEDLWNSPDRISRFISVMYCSVVICSRSDALRGSKDSGTRRDASQCE